MKESGIERRNRLMKGTDNFLPSRTQKQFADETDINRIMKKYHATGMVTHLARNPGRYADLTGIKDYAQSLQAVINAENAFNILPSEIRNRFENNPQKLIDFLSDDSNREEAQKLNLIPKTQSTTQTTNTTPEKTPISTT